MRIFRKSHERNQVYKQDISPKKEEHIIEIQPSAGYSFTMRLYIKNIPGMLARVHEAIGKERGDPGAVDVVKVEGEYKVRNVVAIVRILLEAGAREILVCDSQGIIHPNRSDLSNDVKNWLAANTNTSHEKGLVKDAMKNADLVIGVSGPGIITREDVRSMASDSMVFALANPIPEIQPEEINDVACIIATGRSDYPNQINNVLAFPGIFRGVLDSRASDINEAMKIAAAHAIADCIDENDLGTESIIPSVFNKKVVRMVARAVKKAATESGAAVRKKKYATNKILFVN